MLVANLQINELFQSTPPVWGATTRQRWQLRAATVSIHAPRVGGDVGVGLRLVDAGVSIHAPRVGGDARTRRARSGVVVFQSTPPVWGATRSTLAAWSWPAWFQSTPPVWGATAQGLHRAEHRAVSIHAPRVGGDKGHLLALHKHLVSIHAPRVGGDAFDAFVSNTLQRFQSTPPVWGATVSRNVQPGSINVSIHAPRVGGDNGHLRRAADVKLFQSTPPVWGATLSPMAVTAWPSAFQSTPPVWGATGCLVLRIWTGQCQSTPPVWGATLLLCLRFAQHLLFQSTPPVWGATIGASTTTGL